MRMVFLNVLIIGLLFKSGIGLAGGLDVSISDQNGNDVENAVILLYPSDVTSLEGLSAPYAPKMSQRDMAFVPHVLPVYKGTIVTFPNNDETRHHVYSFSKPKVFELRLYDGDETKTVEFDQSGIVALGCNIHDFMLGYVYVTDTPLFLRSDIDGNTQFKNLADGAYKMKVWHPRLRGKIEATEQSIEIKDGETLQKSLEIRLKRERRNRGPY